MTPAPWMAHGHRPAAPRYPIGPRLPISFPSDLSTKPKATRYPLKPNRRILPFFNSCLHSPESIFTGVLTTTLFGKEMKTLLLTTLLCLLVVSTSHAEEQTSLKQTSNDGIRGWTLATAKHSKGEWMNSTLVIVTKAKVEKKFRASRAFIEVWGLADSDTAVVVRSRNSHGPSWIEKFDIATGKLVAECQGSNYLKDTPKWAQPWCDKSKKEAEQ